MIGLDYTARIDPAHLRAAGISVVCRYIAPQQWKVITLGEYRELTASGLIVLLNWESFADDWLHGAAGGASDGATAARMAHALGYPSGSVVIGSCDFNLSQAQALGVCTDYAIAFRDALKAGGYKAGVYGPKRALDIGQQHGFAFGWQSMSTAWFGNNQLHPFANLRQRGTLTVGGVEGDWNEIINLGGTDVSEHTDFVIDAWRNGNPQAADGSNIEPVKWRKSDEAWQKQINSTLAALTAATGAGFTDAQVAALAQAVSAALVASNANGLTAADHAGVQSDVQAALATELKKLAAAA